MVRLTDILDKVKSYHPAADIDLINKAYVYSARMHEGQMRKAATPTSSTRSASRTSSPT